jgi:hypothetical protein
MRSLVIAGCAVLFSIALVSMVARAAEHGLVQKAFLMRVAEDGKPSPDYFEVWDTYCLLSASQKLAGARCSITAVSFVEIKGVTHLFTWRHDSQSIQEVHPGVFRIEMNGRWSDCSGLQVIIRFDQELIVVESIEGDMRAGTQCQSRTTFSLDRARPTRAIAPLWNPAYW